MHVPLVRYMYSTLAANYCIFLYPEKFCMCSVQYSTINMGCGKGKGKGKGK